MPTRLYVMLLIAYCVMITGCVTTPAPVDATVSGYSVGDRARAVFDEVVVSLPFRGANSPYQNLHVAVTAFINPIRKTTADPYEAQGVVQRCEPRIAVRLSQVLAEQGERSLNDTPAMRNLAQTQAQAVVDEAMRQWKHGPDYRVEVAVASLYWTDASVGQPATASRRGWW